MCIALNVLIMYSVI